jgi:hypothetical protein
MNRNMRTAYIIVVLKSVKGTDDLGHGQKDYIKKCLREVGFFLK